MDRAQRYVIGFALVRMVTGLKNFWVLTKEYHRSRLYLYETRDELNQLELVTTLTNLCECIGLVFGYLAYKWLNVRSLAVICILGTIIGFFNSHLVTDDVAFMFLYPVTTGLFSGLIAISIIFPLLGYSKEKVGRVLAYSRCAFLFGVFPVYGLLKIVNPDDEEMVKVENHKGNLIKAYEPSLMGRFTSVMCYHCISILCLGVFGVLIMNKNLNIKNKYHEEKKKMKKNKGFNSEPLVVNTIFKLVDENYSNKSMQSLSFRAKLQVLAISTMYFVMIFHYNYYENYYNDHPNYKKSSEVIFLIDIIALLLIGWLYDTCRNKQVRNYTLSFNFVFLAGFAVHTFLINYCSVEYTLYLYVPFSILTNSIEIVIVMNVISFYDKLKIQGYKPIQALKTFSIISVAPLVACFINLYWESNLLMQSAKSKFGTSDIYKEPNFFEIKVSIGMLSVSLFLSFLMDYLNPSKPQDDGQKGDQKNDQKVPLLSKENDEKV